MATCEYDIAKQHTPYQNEMNRFHMQSTNNLLIIRNKQTTKPLDFQMKFVENCSGILPHSFVFNVYTMIITSNDIQDHTPNIWLTLVYFFTSRPFSLAKPNYLHLHTMNALQMGQRPIQSN